MTFPISFQPPSQANPSIRLEEVHLWRAWLDFSPGSIRRLEKLLSDEERVRADAFHFPSDREHFIGGHGLLRILLGRYLSSEPQEIRFRTSRYGKPELDAGQPAALTFNLSHTNRLALYTFSLNRQVGIDVEEIHPVPEAESILRQYFSTQEQERWIDAPPGERDRLFLEWWTAREAYLKARGEGLGELERSGSEANLPAGWEMVSFQPIPGHIAALAVEGKIGKLSAWEIPEGWIQSAGGGRAG